MGMILGNSIAGRGAAIGRAGIPIHHPARENGTMGRKTPFAGISARHGNPGCGPGPRAPPPMGFPRGITSLVAVEGPEPAPRSGLGDRGVGGPEAKTPTGLASGSRLVRSAGITDERCACSIRRQRAYPKCLAPFSAYGIRPSDRTPHRIERKSYRLSWLSPPRRRACSVRGRVERLP